MRTNSNERPPKVINLGNGRYHYNYNITEGTRTEIGPDGQETSRPDFNCDTVEIAGVPEDVAREALRLASHKLPCKC